MSKKFFVKRGNKVLFECEGDDVEIRDEYHSMHELYQHRMILSKALFHAYREFCLKSKLHSDGTMFEGGYFIVQMNHPIIGQISYHYKLKHWNEFNLKEAVEAERWDGHTSLDALERLNKL